MSKGRYKKFGEGYCWFLLFVAACNPLPAEGAVCSRPSDRNRCCLAPGLALSTAGVRAGIGWGVEKFIGRTVDTNDGVSNTDAGGQTQFALEEDERYEWQLTLYSRNSNEKAMIRDVIRRVGMSVVARNVLDIGAGDGAVTEIVRNIVTQSLWVVEPNTKQVPVLRARLSPDKESSPYDLKIVHGLWQEVYEDIPHDFDLIILSHMLYYIDPGDIPSVLESVVSKLQPGGTLVIVLNSLRRGRQVHGSYSHFIHEVGDSRKAVLEPQTMIGKVLRRQGYSVETVQISPVVVTGSFDDFFEIGLFLLLEPASAWDDAGVKKIKDYLRGCVVDGRFQMSMPQDVLIIRKNINPSIPQRFFSMRNSTRYEMLDAAI
ncbi:MAG: class I SAM-dependent methyltransferase [Candidatus Omnitrophica bacterium]|nr:class I SAM-dependent methyltransferase [Candidatus Omnitrophota bacterium]